MIGQPNRILGRRPGLRALLISVLCFLAGILSFALTFGMFLDLYGDAGVDALVAFLLLDFVIGIAASAAVGPVRGSTVGNALLFAAGIVSSFALPAWIVAVVRFGERRSLSLDATIVMAMALGSTGMSLWHDTVVGATPLNPLITAGFVAAVTTGVVLWGRVRGTRAALLNSAREQAESAEFARVALERSREAEIGRARAEERSALARDMHDGISHRLSIIAMHSGALASREDLHPEQVRAASRTIHNAAADAGELLREALTALRSQNQDAQPVPLPTAESIERLVVDQRENGRKIALTWSGLAPDDLEADAAQSVTAAHIVEELLMNAAKHAPDETVDISISREEGMLVLRSCNRIGESGSASTFGTGHGLVGVTERAALRGGSAEYGPTPDGRFEAEVRLPWQRTD